MHIVIGREVDEEETVIKTRNFLETDLPKLASLADRDVTSLSSPQLSWSSSHATVSRQDTLINHWAADVALEAIHAAAQHIPSENHLKDIFIYIYFRHYAELQVTNRFMISRSTLRRRKKVALLEFAKRLEVQKVSHTHNCDWLESLVVVKSES